VGQPAPFFQQQQQQQHHAEPQQMRVASQRNNMVHRSLQEQHQDVLDQRNERMTQARQANGRMNPGNGRMAQRSGVQVRGHESRIENGNDGKYLQRLQRLAEQRQPLQHHQVRHIPPQQQQQRPMHREQHGMPQQRRGRDGEVKASSNASAFSLFGGNSLFGGDMYIGEEKSKSIWGRGSGGGASRLRSSYISSSGPMGGERMAREENARDLTPIGPRGRGGRFNGNNKRNAYEDKGSNNMRLVSEVVMASGFLESSFMEEKLGFLSDSFAMKNDNSSNSSTRGGRNHQRKKNDHFVGINELREGSEEIREGMGSGIFSSNGARPRNGRMDGQSANNGGDRNNNSPFLGTSLGFLGTIGPQENNGQRIRKKKDPTFMKTNDPFFGGSNEQPNLSWL